MTKKNKKQDKKRIVFIGTPDFAANILESLLDSPYDIPLIITAPDKPVGRKQIITPPAVKILAEKNKKAFIQPEKISESFEQITQAAPDIIITAAYGQIIPQKILDLPKFGCLNIHGSLLPKYRGASPIQTAILKGEEKTGITIIFMTEKMDAGPIVAKEEIEITKDDTAESLGEKLAKLGAKLLKDILPDYFESKIICEEQDHHQADYCGLIEKNDGRIFWNNPAKEIERMIRAYMPWPKAFGVLEDDSKINIFQARVSSSDNEERAYGEIFLTHDKEIGVQTGEDSLVLEKIQPAGKIIMTGQEYLNGHPEIIGKKFA